MFFRLLSTINSFVIIGITDTFKPEGKTGNGVFDVPITAFAVCGIAIGTFL